MGLVVDLTGKKFGRLTVISEVSERNIHRHVYWNCVCECGNDCQVVGNHLKNGHTKSCGCFSDENRRQTKHGYNRRGKTKPEYRIWSNMKYRCERPQYKEYHLYGGRGISVCERWQRFENFIADMGDRPSNKHSLDRKNNDLGYCKSNCRWATIKEQQRNRRSNRWITLDGEMMILKDWADKLKTTPSNILTMLKRKKFKQIVDYYTNNRRKSRLTA